MRKKLVKVVEGEKVFYVGFGMGVGRVKVISDCACK